jgi:hypothetical protein
MFNGSGFNTVPFNDDSAQSFGYAYLKTASDAFDLYDNGGTKRIQERLAGDVATVIDQIIAQTTGAVVNSKTANDTITMTDAGLRYILRGRTHSDSAVLSDAALDYILRNRIFSDALTATDQLLPFRLRWRLASDALSVTDGLIGSS